MIAKSTMERVSGAGESTERVMRQWQAFSSALNFGRLDAARDILARAGQDRAAVLHFTKTGTNQLHTTILLKRLDLVEFLLDCGSDPNCRERSFNKYSPLELAVQVNSIDIARMLLSAGAESDARKADQHSTALMLAVRSGYEDLALFLIGHGAACDEKTVNHNSESTGDLALKADLPKVVLALAEKGNVAGVPLRRAVAANAFKVVDACLGHPQLRQPAVDHLDGLLPECRGDDMRQKLLSWRTENTIGLAIDETTRDAVPAVSRCKGGMSL